MLSSQRISHGLRSGPEGWQLWVEDHESWRAERALLDYERENEAKPAPASDARDYGTTQAGYILGALLLLLHLLAQTDGGFRWYELGSARAAAILSGEIWRTVTALTLHADLPHVLGNALACAVFVSALCYWIGPGAGTALTLLAGALGNYLNALVRAPSHDSVGASTAIFGAIGLLAGRSFAHRRGRQLRRGRAWLPLAGGLGLLAMLGTGGERTDVSAHLCGLLAGSALGIATGYTMPRPPRARLQAALIAASLSAVAGAWLLAL